MRCKNRDGGVGAGAAGAGAVQAPILDVIWMDLGTMSTLLVVDSSTLQGHFLPGGMRSTHNLCFLLSIV